MEISLLRRELSKATRTMVAVGKKVSTENDDIDGTVAKQLYSHLTRLFLKLTFFSSHELKAFSV